MNLNDVKNEFSKWRVTRKRNRDKIPEYLWNLALKQCETHSVGKVSKTLGLGYRTLKNKFHRLPETQQTRVIKVAPVHITDSICKASHMHVPTSPKPQNSVHDNKTLIAQLTSIQIFSSANPEALEAMTSLVSLFKEER